MSLHSAQSAIPGRDPAGLDPELSHGSETLNAPPPLKAGGELGELRSFQDGFRARHAELPLDAQIPANDDLTETALSPETNKILNSLEIEDIRGILSGHRFNGRNGIPDVEPFKFKVSVPENGILKDEVRYAEGVGLEGFSATLSHLVDQQARFEDGFVGHCLKYLETILWPRHRKLCSQVAQLVDQAESVEGSQVALHRAFAALVRGHTATLQRKVLEHHDDRRELARNTSQYHIFLRAFSLESWREKHGLPNPPGKNSGKFFDDLIESDLQWFKDHGFNCLRFLGTYPIGELNSKAKDKGAGSPFALKSYDIDEESHGSCESLRRVRAMAEEKGINLALEIVPNHYACDAPLLREDPTLFIHTFKEPADPTGYFKIESEKHGTVWVRHGGYYHVGDDKRYFWTDTAQLDYSNPRTVDLLANNTIDLIDKTGACFIRVDSAFQLKNANLELLWGGGTDKYPGEMSSPLPDEEVLKTYIAKVREKHPGVVFVAEALGGHFDYLSECGFDLIYGMYNMQRKGAPHHVGFHEALRKKQHEPNSIREAIWRASYLHNQVGGADIIVFNGQLDEPAPHKVLQDPRWFKGATALAYLKPGAFSHYGGVESGFERPCDEDQKVFTFNRAFKIDWSLPSEHGDFMIGLMKLRKELQDTYGPNVEMVPLRPTKDEETWVGYAIRSRDSDVPPFFVIANPSDAPTTVNIREFPEFDFSKDSRFKDGMLQPVGKERSVLLFGLGDN